MKDFLSQPHRPPVSAGGQLPQQVPVGRAHSAFCLTTMIKPGDGVGAEGQVQGSQTAQKHMLPEVTSPRCGTCGRGSLDPLPPCNSDWGWGEVAEGKREGERGCTGLGQAGGRSRGRLERLGGAEIPLKRPETETDEGGSKTKTKKSKCTPAAPMFPVFRTNHQ